MKYIIDVPGEQDVTYGTEGKIYLAISEGIASMVIGIDAEPYTEPDRKTSENEVWEFVKEIILRDNGTRMSGMFENELNECFGYPYYSDMFANLSYQEAKSKYETWKKQKDELHVGDEVQFTSEVTNTVIILVITRIDGSRFDGMNNKGILYMDRTSNLWKKTGRHFDEVEELLKKMKGEE